MRPNYSGPSGSIPILFFWERLDRLEVRHKRAQSQLERARGGLERLKPREAEGLRLAWQRYCKVIAELERATAEFESLRAYAR